MSCAYQIASSPQRTDRRRTRRRLVHPGSNCNCMRDQPTTTRWNGNSRESRSKGWRGTCTRARWSRNGGTRVCKRGQQGTTGAGGVEGRRGGSFRGAPPFIPRLGRRASPFLHWQVGPENLDLSSRLRTPIDKRTLSIPLVNKFWGSLFSNQIQNIASMTNNYFKFIHVLPTSHRFF
jgi:hypothetical protein